MRTGYYCADEIRGVHFVGELLEESEVDVMKPWTFYDKLSTTQEPIYTYFDSSTKDIFEVIEEDYGVH